MVLIVVEIPLLFQIWPSNNSRSVFCFFVGGQAINVPSYCWSSTRQVQDVGVSMLFVVIFFLARSMVHFSPHETVLCVWRQVLLPSPQLSFMFMTGISCQVLSSKQCTCVVLCWWWSRPTCVYTKWWVPVEVMPRFSMYFTFSTYFSTCNFFLPSWLCIIISWGQDCVILVDLCCSVRPDLVCLLGLHEDGPLFLWSKTHHAVIVSQLLFFKLVVGSFWVNLSDTAILNECSISCWIWGQCIGKGIQGDDAEVIFLSQEEWWRSMQLVMKGIQRRSTWFVSTGCCRMHV
jgi:hypothetical protein